MVGEVYSGVFGGEEFQEPADPMAWVEDQEYQYEIWTDDDERTLSVTYGAADDASAWFPERVSVILDADGNLLLEYMDDVSTGTHPTDVLADCKILFGP